MSSSSLESRIVRLAYHNKDLRPVLLPLIKEAKKGQKKKKSKPSSRPQSDTSFAERVLSDFEFIASLKRNLSQESWTHPKTNEKNNINTIIEKARENDKWAFKVISRLYKQYQSNVEEEAEDGTDEERREAREKAKQEIREAFEELDFSDLSSKKSAQEFCKLVSSKMVDGSWTGRRTIIGELIDDTAWTVESAYAPLVQAVGSVFKAMDKDGDGNLSLSEIGEFVAGAASYGLDLELDGVKEDGVAFSYIKNAMQEAVLSAVLLKLNLGKGIKRKVLNKVIGKLIDRALEGTPLDNVLSDVGDYIAKKADVAGESVGFNKLGTNIRAKATASIVTPSEINDSYKKKVSALAKRASEAEDVGEVEKVAKEARKLSEQYFTEASVDIERAIQSSLAYRHGQPILPDFVNTAMMKLSSERDVKLSKSSNHTGLVLSYLEQQVFSMLGDYKYSESMRPHITSCYGEVMKGLSDKEVFEKLLEEA